MFTVMNYLQVSEGNNHMIAPDVLKAVTEAMSSVPGKCKRVAGRTVPIEVFCAMRANTFLERSRLTLPHYVSTVIAFIRSAEISTSK